jgi:hypothetical protein
MASIAASRQETVIGHTLFFDPPLSIQVDDEDAEYDDEQRFYIDLFVLMVIRDHRGDWFIEDAHSASSLEPFDGATILRAKAIGHHGLWGESVATVELAEPLHIAFQHRAVTQFIAVKHIGLSEPDEDGVLAHHSLEQVVRFATGSVTLTVGWNYEANGRPVTATG